ncbi:hypothetical protein ATI61_110220 [Archangium gephyra]|uniref:Uncharacterized protein n=1 Tax=Archangium gephyra TaxID=48 RepID=A0AAC8QF96_9BACT|nr:hypothetical protein [Archangium gephyra]AKJ06036.1 Hypothetical protein AA314_07662 [Archangium gephyra]REG27213.1 hypothetical protein ATI61_110220 [Archangium gephyra]
MKAIRNTWVLAVLVGLGVIAVWFFARSEREMAVPVAVKAPSVTGSRAEPAPAAAPVPPQERVPELLAAPQTIPGEEGEHGEFTTTTDVLKQKIFKREPKLAQFDYFREHVLLDSSTRESYRALLADRELLEQTRRELLTPPPGDPGAMESNIQRLMRVDYLREALDWKENPDRAHLVSTLEHIILEDSFGPEMTRDVKRAITASKMELYEILSRQEPERALRLVERARGGRLEKLLQYFAEWDARRAAMERELSLQARGPTLTR